MKKILIAIFMIASLSACESIPVSKTIETAVNTKLLYEEFEAAEKQLLELPLPIEQRRLLRAVIDEIDTVRIELSLLRGIEAGKVLLSREDVKTYLDRLAAPYNVGFAIVSGYYAANKIKPPTSLIDYHKSAIQAHAALREQAYSESKKSVDIDKLTSILGKALRFYAAVNTGVPI